MIAVLGATLTVTGWPAASRGVRKMALKHAYRAVARHWHRKILPGHFEKKAYRKYRYQRRKYKDESGQRVWHNRRGERRTGPWRPHEAGSVDPDVASPLVFTGDLREILTGPQEIRATAKGAKIVLRGPKYFYQHDLLAHAPDKVDEVTRITRREEHDLAGVFVERLNEGMEGLKAAKRIRIR